MVRIQGDSESKMRTAANWSESTDMMAKDCGTSDKLRN